jgi:hypothetical protein
MARCHRGIDVSLTAVLSTSRGRLMLVALGVTTAAAAVLAAWLDWWWWEAYRGLTITLWAGGLLLAAGVLATIRPVRLLALFPLAAAIGVVIGQNLGPARPDLHHSDGVATVSLVAPAVTTGTTPVACARDAAGTELSISGDPNLRLTILPVDSSLPADIDGREFVSVSWTVGDRWREGAAERADGIALLLMVQGERADSPATRMATGPDSSLALVWTEDRGTLQFADLVHVTDEPDAPGPPIDLAGTISWSC